MQTENRSLGLPLQAGEPSGLLNFVLRALRVLRPCDSRNDASDSENPNFSQIDFFVKVV